MKSLFQYFQCKHFTADCDQLKWAVNYQEVPLNGTEMSELSG